MTVLRMNHLCHQGPDLLLPITRQHNHQEKAGPQLTLDSEDKCPHGFPSCISDFTAV